LWTPRQTAVHLPTGELRGDLMRDAGERFTSRRALHAPEFWLLVAASLAAAGGVPWWVVVPLTLTGLSIASPPNMLGSGHGCAVPVPSANGSLPSASPCSTLLRPPPPPSSSASPSAGSGADAASQRCRKLPSGGYCSIPSFLKNIRLRRRAFSRRRLKEIAIIITLSRSR
jgi:hypothetical protein